MVLHTIFHRDSRFLAAKATGIVGAITFVVGMTTSAIAQPVAPPATSFKAIPLPDPGIPGYSFPTAPTVITDWAKANKQAEIQRHAWGIWTSLTRPSGETFEGQSLLVFETWETPDDIIAGGAGAVAKLSRRPNVLKPLRQFSRFPHLNANAKQDGETVTGFVKYDPVAAAHIRTQKLFSATALQGLLTNGKTSVEDFPATSVALKPVFITIPKKQLIQGRYFKLQTWPGPPNAPKAFPTSAWDNCVWIDVLQVTSGTSTGKTDKSCVANGSSRTAATTYGIGNFVSFKLSAADIAAMPSAPSGVVPGDFSVLVAMHVTSREFRQWTWQTFWWSPDSNAPPAPSSASVAALRPAQLTGAARHYAQCAAYQTLSPPQPDEGGQNKGDSVYCYNPYLEAGFGTSVLPDSIPGTFKGKVVSNNVGVQTNCMSCHAAASFNPKQIPTAPNYSGDRYVDLKDPRFKGTLQTDFLWSISGNAN